MLVGWLIALHLAAVLLFTRGFLLSRLSLPNISYHDPNTPSPIPTHTRAVILIIDSLRFDFLYPHHPHHSTLNPYYHNALTLPAELTSAYPQHSFLFNSYADPPTATLQRIKALTTGSLPTFIDIGSNFGASAILEDSIINQLQHANKTMAFMGDDTWVSVFPDSFHPNLTFPYDSFNVEDLHTVDTGVLTHLFPLLLNQHPSAPKKFDFLLGHFLGVDHVGHRVGPSHPSMHAKLKQMDAALRKVVSLLDDDTLLVVLGDHGMDRAGDHGGDGVLETSAALWIYSKGSPLIDSSLGAVPSGLIQYKTFPGTSEPWRSVQQIDLVPTLSLLLGLPIPYNNLGSVIPELFWRKSDTQTELSKALQLNSLQIHRYLQTYRSSSSGSELDAAWTHLQNIWDAIALIPKLKIVAPSQTEPILVALMNYNRTALNSCRAIWAQFNPVLMAAGLALMISTLLTSCVVYLALSNSMPQNKGILTTLVPSVWKISIGGALATFMVYQALCTISPGLLGLGVGIGAMELAIFVGAMLSCVTGIVIILTTLPSSYAKIKPIVFSGGGLFCVLILGLHTASFFSNSFTFWEDRLVLWLCVTSVVPFLLCGISAPGVRPSQHGEAATTSTPFQPKGQLSLQSRILGFTLLFLVCVRLMSLVTVCREEQGSHCHVTFYATPSTTTSVPELNTTMMSPPLATIPITTTSTTPPKWSLFLSLPTALLLPYIVTRILRATKSDKGIAPFVIWSVFAPALAGAWVFWILEWMETTTGVGNSSANAGVLDGIVAMMEEIIRLRAVRTWVARGVVGLIWVGLAGWWIIPVCLDIRVSLSGSIAENEANKPPPQVVILGYANAFGAPFLVFYLLVFAFVYLCTPLPGQVTLGLSLLALLAYLEALDGVRDVWELDWVVQRSVTPLQAQESPSAIMAATTTFSTTLPLILLAFITFYATGHQSTVSSIQWKTGFVLSESVRYPWSVLTVVGNSLGPFWLLGIGVSGLVGGWKQSPAGLGSREPGNIQTNLNTSPKAGTLVMRSALGTTLLIQIYFLSLLSGTSLSAAVLRRHLMVWKVFAPRFMTGVVQLLMVDLGILGLWGVLEPSQAMGKRASALYGVAGRVAEKVGWVLGKVGIGGSKAEGKNN